MNEKRKNFIRLIISGTKDISTAFLEEHREIVEVQIIDEENRESDCQEEPYTREDFLQIRQKIDEIKEKIEIPDSSDENREKKIFMQVYNILGKKIDYNHYAVTEEGRKDSVLRITCRNLKDGLLKGKAVCAGYADNIKLERFPLEYCCSSLEEFNSAGSGELTHDMFVTVDEGEISEFSSEDQLRFLGFSEEEIEKKLHPSLEDLLKILEAQQKMEAATVSMASEIKASDFDEIEKAFDDKEKKEQIDYVK